MTAVTQAEAQDILFILGASSSADGKLDGLDGPAPVPTLDEDMHRVWLVAQPLWPQCFYAVMTLSYDFYDKHEDVFTGLSRLDATLSIRFHKPGDAGDAGDLKSW